MNLKKLLIFRPTSRLSTVISEIKLNDQVKQNNTTLSVLAGKEKCLTWKWGKIFLSSQCVSVSLNKTIFQLGSFV